jgi:hypothetical protein
MIKSLSTGDLQPLCSGAELSNTLVILSLSGDQPPSEAITRGDFVRTKNAPSTQKVPRNFRNSQEPGTKTKFIFSYHSRSLPMKSSVFL